MTVCAIIRASNASISRIPGEAVFQCVDTIARMATNIVAWMTSRHANSRMVFLNRDMMSHDEPRTSESMSICLPLASAMHSNSMAISSTSMSCGKKPMFICGEP